MSDPQKYTVGWICAITTESVAARAFLDEEHDGPCQVSQHDNNSYALGQVGGHNVVIAILPDAEYGIVPAAAVARDMLHSFPNVRIGLMVGIGGGAPSRKRDVRLGDVVVSSRDGGKGGVFHYDFGKTIQNQSFQETAFLDQPPLVLRTTVSTLRGTYEMKGHQLVDDPDFMHPSQSSDGCDVACGNDETHLVVRKERDEEEDDPVIHYGLIASGSQLMKDARIRDKLADGKGVLCFETEAAGLMNHFPCLVIRGICDYSDSHKNKEWQGFAAMMAAAYANNLLLVTMEHNDRLAQLDRWLRPPDPSTNFNHARKQWHEGSGLWFLNSAAFNEWKHGSHRHLWLHGLAGCDKTVLSATIVDHLRKMDDCVTLEFYFDFNDTAKQKMDGVLRSLLFQLYKLGSRSKDLDSLYQCHLDGQRQPDTLTLTNCLRAMIKGSKTTYVILDALDECLERKELLGWMKEFFTIPDLSHVHLIATGRPEEEFLSFIPGWLGNEHCLPLDKNAVNADIRSYVRARLEQSSDFVDKGLSQDLLEQIRNKVGDRADGMFRWAACQLASLATCMSPRAIEIALETLPRDLDETYRRMLRSIPADIEKDAMRLLQFLVHTKRPLTLLEAVEVIATQTDEERRGFDPKRRLFREADILRHCPSLVKELHLAHFSVKEYLLKQDQFDLTSASVGSSWKIKQDFPMARYAAEYWMGYATSAETSEAVVRTAVRFLQDESTFQRWSRLYQADRESDSDPGPPRASRLYYTCLGGLVAIAISLLGEGADVNAQGGRYGNALQAASSRGYREVVQLLLDNGADVNAQGDYYGNALQAASSRGYREVVQLLLDNGADVNAQGGYYGNALYTASSRGHREVVQLLLDNGADVNAQGDYYGNALQAASSRGYREVVQLLLDNGADVNAQGDYYGSALQAASDGGHREVVGYGIERLFGDQAPQTSGKSCGPS
ncbi:uncharacterized protein B0I36DRAFT_378693 [Microdochium trichocladiopsis]|uniref:Nucleoside phosphorylase domain-containing protein n=1 Tax=Microdochium trichocladiopsis TaxID=1682393 RepID=A0A9P8XS49_9PEZI|nr:uncharacterized protein B0I36DRAFT_378693 [Microdochium trichocladiopsis]KAH7007957.1 hypothetical protein B0I36DRAFT_378693 [Microdochium trichocladiopsis]